MIVAFGQWKVLVNIYNMIEGFEQRIYPIIRDKIFFSRISGQRAEVVEQLPETIVPGKVLFDGIIYLYDSERDSFMMALKALRTISSR